MRHSRFISFSLAFLILITACNLPSSPVSTPPPPPSQTFMPQVEPATLMPSPFPSETATPTLFFSPVPTLTAPFTATILPSVVAVTITASTGNINVRRGPGVGYNPVAGLLKGQTATATARDANGDWLLITLPSSTKTGWVSARTKFSTLTGDPASLPVMSMDAPKPAYFRNCTFHPMLVQPAEVVIPPQSESPDNKVQFNPGEYEIIDASLAGEPTVLEATLFEGQTIDIRTDGIPNTYSCP